jgi:hypothetical protein
MSRWCALLVVGALACTGSEPVDPSDSDTPVETEVDSEAPDPNIALIEAYCTCVFSTCHEHYHDRWGEDEITSAALCRQEAGELVESDPDALSCRSEACAGAANEDPIACPVAVGVGGCAG